MIAVSLCAAVGLAFIASRVLQVGRWVADNFFCHSAVFDKYKAAGNWAVVTGASDGIGKAISLDLARRGFNVVIIARTQSKLDEVAKEISEMGKESRIIVFDFLTSENHEFDALGTILAGLPVGVLVNNVGILSGPEFFESVPLCSDVDMVKVNIESQLRMTKLLLPHMKSKECGAIVNLSSVSATQPSPLLTTYAATKAFNLTFSDCLRVEVSKYGIDVLTVTPGLVCSQMSKRVQSSFDCPLAADMAKQTVDKLRLNTTTHGHRNHGLMFNLTSLLPYRWLVRLNFGALLDFREKQRIASSEKEQKKTQ